MSSMFDALRFVNVAQRDKGTPYQTHVRLRDGMAVGYDGVLAAGHAIEEQIDACPHSFTLLKALRRCKGVLSVAQLDAERLSVRGGQFKATIKCFPDAVLTSIEPDAYAGPADNRLRDTFKILSPLVSENSAHVVTASILVRSGSAVATNNQIVMEHWHGLALPTVAVPKLFVNALRDVKKDIVGYGASLNSLTIYFEGGCWLKTQLYTAAWPDLSLILDKQQNPVPLPTDFDKALADVLEFAPDNRVQLCEGVLRTSEEGAEYEVPGLNADVTFNGKQLAIIVPHVKTIDFNGDGKSSVFFGENLRGVISHVRS